MKPQKTAETSGPVHRRMEKQEMVRRYAHLAPSHLTEYAKQIDAIFGQIVPNLSHMGLRDGTDD